MREQPPTAGKEAREQHHPTHPAAPLGVPIYPPGGMQPEPPPPLSPSADPRRGDRSRWFICCGACLLTIVLSAACGVLAYYMFFNK